MFDNMDYVLYGLRVKCVGTIKSKIKRNKQSTLSNVYFSSLYLNNCFNFHDSV